MAQKVKLSAIYAGKSFKDDGYHKKTIILLRDLTTSEGKIVAEKVALNNLKRLTKLKPRVGDVIEFEGTLEVSPIIAEVKNPTKVVLKEEDGFRSVPEELSTLLLNKFLKPAITLDKVTASQQTVAITRLYRRGYNTIDFWKFVSLPFALNSLNFFLTSKGLGMLETQKKLMKKQKTLDFSKESVILESSSVVEPNSGLTKRQTYMEFLK